VTEYYGLLATLVGIALPLVTAPHATSEQGADRASAIVFAILVALFASSSMSVDAIPQSTSSANA
jgi:hypothetical protein